MKAIVLDKYGSTDDLVFKDYPKPKIKPNEVLIRMLYTSINSADLDFINGHPLVRFTGMSKPGYPILGSDCVGEVVELGSEVQNLLPGDMVWADTSNPLSYGTFAEYLSVPADELQILPEHMNPEYASCLPTAAMVALQNVNIKNKPKKGDKILVNGAGGGIGTILVQLLSALGTDITAVDKAEKHNMLKTLGANRTIDYREIDYTDEDIEYDYVYDLLCTNKLRKVMSVTKKNGQIIMLGGSTGNMLNVLAFGPLISLFWRRKIKLGGWETNNHKDLEELARLYKEGTIKPVIDKIIPLEETIEGLKLLEEGYILGKIVVKCT